MRAVEKVESCGIRSGVELPGRQVNVTPSERWVSLVLGSMLVVGGLKRRSTLGLLEAFAGGFLIYRGQSGHCAMLEISGAGEEKSEIPLEIRHKVTVNCSPDVAYKFCKDLHQAARMLSDSQQLTSDAGHWNWTWQGPAGMKMSCQVELVEDRPNTLLAWKSLANSPLQTIAEMHFHGTPGNQTTEVHLRLEIMPPGGLIGKTAGTLVKPMISSQIREHLCRLKGILESSESTASGRSPEEEVASSAAQPTRRTSMPASVTDPVEGASQKSFPASDAPSRFTAQSGPKIPDELRHKATGK